MEKWDNIFQNIAQDHFCNALSQWEALGVASFPKCNKCWHLGRKEKGKCVFRLRGKIFIIAPIILTALWIKRKSMLLDMDICLFFLKVPPILGSWNVWITKDRTSLMFSFKNLVSRVVKIFSWYKIGIVCNPVVYSVLLKICPME